MCFCVLQESLLGRRDDSETFVRNMNVSVIKHSRRINKIINTSYKWSGKKLKFQQKFTPKQIQKLLTTSSMAAEPTSAAPVIAQLSHSQAMGDAVYRLKQRRQEGGLSIHTLARALELSHEQDHVSQCQLWHTFKTEKKKSSPTGRKKTVCSPDWYSRIRGLCCFHTIRKHFATSWRRVELD